MVFKHGAFIGLKIIKLFFEMLDFLEIIYLKCQNLRRLLLLDVEIKKIGSIFVAPKFTAPLIAREFEKWAI